MAFALSCLLVSGIGAAPPDSAPAGGGPRAAAEIRGDRKTLVVLGDSLAAGYGVDPSEAYPAVLQQMIDHAGGGFRVVNAGVSGDTSAGALRRIDWQLRRPIDVLLIEIGGNDGLRGQSPQALRTNLIALIERARQKQPGTLVVLAGMKMPPNMGTYAADFERVYPEVARTEHVSYVPHLLDGVGGVPAMNQADGIHPTPEGHRQVATNIWAVLGPALHRLRDPRP